MIEPSFNIDEEVDTFLWETAAHELGEVYIRNLRALDCHLTELLNRAYHMGELDGVIRAVKRASRQE